MTLTPFDFLTCAFGLTKPRHFGQDKIMDRETEKHILNVLRRGTTTWKGRSECLRRARKSVWDGEFLKNGRKKFKFHWQCAKCLKWFKESSDLEVDHIVEVGPYQGDLHKYAERMYCSVDNLQALCSECHLKKTTSWAANNLYKRKGQES